MSQWHPEQSDPEGKRLLVAFGLAVWVLAIAAFKGCWASG